MTKKQLDQKQFSDQISPNVTTLTQSQILRSLGCNLLGTSIWKDVELMHTYAAGHKAAATNTRLPENDYIAFWVSDVLDYFYVKHNIKLFTEPLKGRNIYYIKKCGVIYTEPAEIIWEGDIKEYPWLTLIDLTLSYLTVTKQFAKIK